MGTNESKLTSSDYRSAANKVRKALLEIDLGADIEHLAVLGVAHMEAEADRLDTEERTDTESFSFLNELAGAFRSGESNPRPSHFPVLEGIRAVLAHLHSAGRLLADGETPFTAEQVEDVRLLAHSVVKTNRGAAFEAMDRLRALLPATEPAEERRSFPTIQDVPNNTLFHTHGGNGSSLFVRNLSGDLRLCLNAGTEWSKLLKESDFPPSSGPYIEVPWSKFPQPWADPFAVPAPAEPAEEVKPISWYRTMELDFAAEHFGFPVKPDSGDWFTASDGGKWRSESNEWELRYYPPAPAEPAEEEAKAEYPHRGLGDLTVLGPEIFTNGEVINWRGENFVRAQDDGICSAKFDGDRVYRCALADGHYGDHTTAKGEHWQKRPTSSPVVPAPTETGPWPTWEAVPEGVQYKGHTESGKLTVATWVNRGGRRNVRKPSLQIVEHGDYADYEMHNFAPFVAAEEG